MAIEIVDNALRNTRQFSRVGADAGYVEGPGFLLALHRRQLQFVVDVHSDFSIYLEEPKPRVSAYSRNTGYQQKQWKTDEPRFEVKELVKAINFDKQPVLTLPKYNG